MKNLIILFVFFFSLTSFSQSKGDVSIEWFEKNGVNINTTNVPQFKGSCYTYDSYNKSLSYMLNLSDNASFEAKDVLLSNIVYESISAEQLGELSPQLISKSPSEHLVIKDSRGVRQLFLTLSPIIKDGIGYKRIKSFSYTTTGNNSSRISKTSKVNAIQNSVLASGDWFQFYVEKSGVYKISKSFLSQLGFNVSGVNPKRIKIYGNGGRMLPLLNRTYYPIDLTENAIQIVGESDGVFNDEDYILFYAEGVDTWNEESKTYVNLYDSKSYYYLTTQGDEGKRIATMSQPTGASTVNLTSFDDRQFHEVDLVNIAKLGRRWFGESFEIKQDQEFLFDFPNIDTSTPIQISLTAAAAAYTITSFAITANETDLGTISFRPISLYAGIEFVQGNLPSNSTIPASEEVKVKMSYNNNSVPGSKAYLDNIILTAKRKLQGYGKQFHFQYDMSKNSNGVVSYTLSNASAISQVWDVTDIYNVSKVENANQSSFSFKANLGELRKYIALDPSDYYVPLKTSKTRVSNQNLKGTLFTNSQGQFQDIDYVIITPSFLNSQAEKLADFHRSYSGLNVKVINLESIYPEFSSGKQDIAGIRNCIKYIYNNASASDKRIKYVNLFGDASYDYKDRIQNNTNIVPIYHALESNSKGEYCFASDDFFGLMDDDEGNIVSKFGGIDIAVGRMLNSDAAQADEMVNKVLDYHDEKSYGGWRNNIVLVSDDSDKTLDASLQNRQNILADKITSEKPFLNANKIFLDSYVQEASAGGFRYPKAREDFFSAFEKGALVCNYLGHGGEDGLASERLWEKSDGQNLSNQYRYPLFITITCEFSRFDNPSKPTAGEYTFWNPKGGAIAMLTTIREIGQYSAENFNDVLAKNLFSYGSNQYTSIAEALRVSKNSSPNFASNVVVCIGDPALKLAIAKPKVRLTKVNDVPVNQSFDDFKSLAKMKINGEIVDENNNLLTNYNGELNTAIYDKFITRTTLNNDGNSPPISFNTLGETIFRGNASVNNGLFEFSFIVPRDIRIPVANGKISFYVKKSQFLEDQTGSDVSIKVGGINENAVADNNNPRVKLYMNDETFVPGGTTNESPFLIAQLEDESGINTASGIGHDIVVILDGDVSNPYVLNDYYQTNLDDFTKGKVRFPLRNLAVGMHTITFKAWDVYNNPVTEEMQFVVVGNESIALSNVLNYPKPCVNYTEFWFSHNRPYEPLEVQVQVFTVTGKIVWTRNQIITTEGFLSKEISWNGKDDFGNKIGKGVYVYKLTVKSNVTNSKTEKFEKLVIL